MKKKSKKINVLVYTPLHRKVLERPHRTPRSAERLVCPSLSAQSLITVTSKNSENIARLENKKKTYKKLVYNLYSTTAFFFRQQQQ